MSATPVAILWCVVMLAMCITVVWWERPKRNRRVRLSRPFTDSRDSIQTFRKMFGGSK